MTKTRVTADYPGSGGQLIDRAEDFEVKERLAYAPEGHGEHLFLRVTKKNQNTMDVAARLARAAAVARRDIGFAGIKDRRAIATQWFSMPLPEASPIPTFELDDVVVHEAVRHPHKLRRGHVVANHFRVAISNVPAGGAARAQAALNALRRRGVPNRFGPQRFGRDGENAERARAILSGTARPPRDRRLADLLISALQADDFERLIELRIRSGHFGRLLLGDLVKKHETGGLFIVEDLAAEQVRADRLEISPTGPLWGKKTRLAAHAAERLETCCRSACLAQPARGLRPPPGTRRPLRYPLAEDARVDALDDGRYEFSGTLPAGAYATVLLDELVKPEAPLTRTIAASDGPAHARTDG